MEDTDLILLVQAHEGLYNRSSFAFKSKQNKQEAWEGIAKELGIDTNMCMKRWVTLRERFSKELRLNAENGNDSTKIQRWPLFNHMTFLLPHMMARGKPYDTSALSISLPTISKRIKDPIDTPRPSPNLSQKSWNVTEQNSYQTSLRKRKLDSYGDNNNNNNDDDNNNCDGDDDAVEKAANAISDLCKKRLKETKNNELEKFGTMLITMMESLSKAKQIRLMVSFMEQVANARLEVEADAETTN